MDRALIEEAAKAAYISHHKNGPCDDAFDEPNMGRGGFKTEVIIWEAVAQAVIAIAIERAAEVAEVVSAHGDAVEKQAGLGTCGERIAHCIRALAEEQP